MERYEKMTPYECKGFFLNIGSCCIGEKDQFLRWVAMARKKDCNIREIKYGSVKGLLEIDTKSAHLIIANLTFKEIELLPLEIIEILDQKEFDKVFFKRNCLMIFLEIVNFQKQNPCAILYAEKI